VYGFVGFEGAFFQAINKYCIIPHECTLIDKIARLFAFRLKKSPGLALGSNNRLQNESGRSVRGKEGELLFQTVSQFNQTLYFLRNIYKKYPTQRSKCVIEVWLLILVI
jgi:hypothetical protein